MILILSAKLWACMRAEAPSLHFHVKNWKSTSSQQPCLHITEVVRPGRTHVSVFFVHIFWHLGQIMCTQKQKQKKNQTKTLFRLPLCAITIDTAYQLAVLSLSFTLTTLLLLRPQTHDCKTGSAAADTAMPTRKWHSLWKRLFLCWGWELSQWQAANKHCLTDWMCSHNPASAGNTSAERSQKWEHH